MPTRFAPASIKDVSKSAAVILPSLAYRWGANVSQPKTQVDLDLLSINTIRTLAIDAVQQANSGHPGAPMGSRRWLTPCGSDFCDTIRLTHCG